MATSADRYPVGYEDIKVVAMVTSPEAGHGSAPHAAEKAMNRFTERGVDVIALQGNSPDHARILIREMLADERISALVACGGDGMINLALQEQADSGIPLGIIPSGTGNDHAREYRLPTNDPAAAADIVADGFTVTTDLGRIRTGKVDEDDGEGSDPLWFGTIMCAGFDSLVSDRVNRMKWPHGRNRYNIAIVLELLTFNALPFRITLDDGTVITQDITLAAFGNTRSYGGGMYICPQADHSDGLLDITVIGEANKPKAAAVFGRVFSGKHVNHREVTQYRTSSAYVEFLGDGGEHEGMNAYADGDYMAPLSVTVDVVPRAGRYLVPRP